MTGGVIEVCGLDGDRLLDVSACDKREELIKAAVERLGIVVKLEQIQFGPG